MRYLFTTTAGAGHFGPLAPFVTACLHGGHEVMVAAPPGLVLPGDVPHWPLGAPAHEDMAAAFGALPAMSHDEADAWVVAEVFARLDATAALPGLLDAVTGWRPDVVVRESAELAAAVAAELHDVPLVRVGIGLAEMEERMIRCAAANVDRLRQANGLPADPAGDRLRDTPYVTLFPASLEAPDFPAPPGTRRYRDPAWPVPRPRRPFVYVTFGSVAGTQPRFAGVYGEALAAVADLDTEVLVTVGRDTDPASFGPVPPHVRVMRWADQATVLGGAAAVVGHGGGGTTLGALAAGVPQVVVPLFAEDQYINARRVAETGAGRIAEPSAASIRDALTAVLTNPGYAEKAQEIATELAGQTNPGSFAEKSPRPVAT
jgi:UDP:flavonoid glycosyltransferase YjiC (YdhE family)